MEVVICYLISGSKKCFTKLQAICQIIQLYHEKNPLRKIYFADVDEYIEIFGITLSADNLYLSWFEPYPELNSMSESRFIGIMNEFGEGKFDVNITEIYFMSVLFIWLIQSVQTRLLKKRNELQNKVRELQLISPRNQLDPHFIYNTFNSIASVIKQGREDEAYDIFVLFSKMVGNNLDNSGEIVSSEPVQIIILFHFFDALVPVEYIFNPINIFSHNMLN